MTRRRQGPQIGRGPLAGGNDLFDEVPVLTHGRGRVIVVGLVFLVVIVFGVIQVLASADRGARAVRAVNTDIEAFHQLFDALAALDELKLAAFGLVQTRSEWALTETERALSRYLALLDGLPGADEIDRKALAYNAKRIRDLVDDVVARSVFENASRTAESLHALRLMFSESAAILRRLNTKNERRTALSLDEKVAGLSKAVTRSLALLALTALFLVAIAAWMEWIAARRQRLLRRSIVALAEGARDLRFGAYDVRSDFGRMLSHLEQLQQQLIDLELENSSAKLALSEMRKKEESGHQELLSRLNTLEEELEKARARGGLARAASSARGKQGERRPRSAARGARGRRRCSSVAAIPVGGTLSLSG